MTDVSNAFKMLVGKSSRRDHVDNLSFGGKILATARFAVGSAHNPSGHWILILRVC
jgi:hypothetical protein